MQLTKADTLPSKPVPARCGLWLTVLVSIFALGGRSAPATSQETIVLVGSGSTVPGPLYTRWAQEYGKHTGNVQFRYLSVGTGEGIKQISHGAGDFAAGEAQLTDREKKDGGLLELPMVIVGIAPVYNLPEVDRELRLSGEVLASIFLGDIKMWNAPQIARLNPDITLPNRAIHVINRPGGKGSNYVFTDFLSKVSPKFRAQIGVTASPIWPVGEVAERSSDMADKVKNTPDAIGFVEYQYALKDKISLAAVLNPAGRFIKPSYESLSAACRATEAPQWNKFSASLTNAAGADSFPIASFSWIYLRLKSGEPARNAALGDLLNWMYGEGQRFATIEGYAELPSPLLTEVRKKVRELQ